MYIIYQKRNILAVHIAKQLSQKKHRSKVGAVHLTNVFGDVRKVGLILTPPILEANNDDIAFLSMVMYYDQVILPITIYKPFERVITGIDFLKMDNIDNFIQNNKEKLKLIRESIKEI